MVHSAFLSSNNNRDHNPHSKYTSLHAYVFM